MRLQICRHYPNTEDDWIQCWSGARYSDFQCNLSESKEPLTSRMDQDGPQTDSGYHLHYHNRGFPVVQ